MGFNNWSFIGLQEWLLHTFFGKRRERRRTTCSVCTGSGLCVSCNGAGCPQCNSDGRCAQCHGEGNILTGTGDARVNG